MAVPRSQQISLIDTKYYHCMSRCVRRAYLCGQDSYSGKSYEHRKQWIEDKIIAAANVFCITLCAYAVMCNHLHIVLHVDEEKSKKMSDKDVVTRWHQLFKGTMLTQKYINNEEISESQRSKLNETIAMYRERLCSISWFMRVISEHIAKKANKEDNCTGRFWEGRFKSQALLDEAALASCMAYVDLNPVRANMVKQPEKSEHTSLRKRINSALDGDQPKYLQPFKTEENINEECLPFDFQSYIELIDLTSKSIITKNNRLTDETIPILEQIGISPQNWLTLTTQFTTLFHGAVGRAQVMQDYCEHLNIRKRISGSSCQKYLT